MSQPVRILLVLAAVVALGALARHPALQATAPGPPPETAQIRPQALAGTLRFDPAVAPADRQAVERAVATALPEARRLIGIVDGLVTVAVGPTGDEGALGVTTGNHDAYRITLDLRSTERLGERGVRRLVLHELGHVIDHALLEDDLMRRLDAAVPAGYACDPGEPNGACAEVEERFAETFAKWATGDIGVGLYIGYKVPPPSVPLADWGRPLADVGR